MADSDTMTLVETVVADISRAIGERFTDQDAQWFTTVLNNFAADVVSRVLPADDPGRAEVLSKAREAGIDVDQVQVPTIG